MESNWQKYIKIFGERKDCFFIGQILIISTIIPIWPLSKTIELFLLEISDISQYRFLIFFKKNFMNISGYLLNGYS